MVVRPRISPGISESEGLPTTAPRLPQCASPCLDGGEGYSSNAAPAPLQKLTVQCSLLSQTHTPAPETNSRQVPSQKPAHVGAPEHFTPGSPSATSQRGSTNPCPATPRRVSLEKPHALSAPVLRSVKWVHCRAPLATPT